VLTWLSNLKAVWDLSKRERLRKRVWAIMVRLWRHLAAAAKEPMAGHRANVWLLVDSVLVLGGIAFMIGGWQHLPSASPADPHPMLWDSTSTAVPFIVGGVMVALGLYVLAAFFLVASHLPGEIAWACLRLRRMLCGDHLLRVRRGGWSLRVAQLTA
jgi:hypothetical protein